MEGVGRAQRDPGLPSRCVPEEDGPCWGSWGEGILTCCWRDVGSHSSCGTRGWRGGHCAAGEEQEQELVPAWLWPLCPSLG